MPRPCPTSLPGQARDDAYDEGVGDDDEEAWLRETEAVRVTAADWLQDVFAETHAGLRAWLDAGNPP